MREEQLSLVWKKKALDAFAFMPIERINLKKDGVIFMCLKPKWSYEESDFPCLEEKIREKQQEIKPLTDKEKERIQLELDIIEKTNTAKVFLLYDDIMFYLKNIGAVFHRVMHCSCVCYLLGLHADTSR